MDKPKKPQRITPYIYSDIELKKLFSAAMTYQKRSSLTYPECVKAILQLTYVLGLRISETMSLRMKDVDPQTVVSQSMNPNFTRQELSLSTRK